ITISLGAYAAATVTPDEANQVALKKAGGGIVVENELEYDDGILVYDITVINGEKRYSMEINANNLAIYEYKERNIDRVDYGVNPADAKISNIKAKEIALAKAGAGTVISCDLEYENRILVYDIDIIDGKVEYDIEVDAINGNIVSFDKDYK
ncbi:PepSY domain-containing protein, partial [Selenomonadales bacterium OttesenSCG-928-I06]|nr:PepSY domain-containing protein [Selenomonadales bacterium OttesenSCG-928-I06]